MITIKKDCVEIQINLDMLARSIATVQEMLEFIRKDQDPEKDTLRLIEDLTVAHETMQAFYAEHEKEFEEDE